MRWTIIAVFGLAACSEPVEEPAVTPSATMSTAPTDDEEPRRLSTQEIAGSLGSDCQNATRSEYRGRTEDQVFYDIQCEASSFRVGVKMNGDVSALPCSVAAGLGNPCWVEWPEPK